MKIFVPSFYLGFFLLFVGVACSEQVPSSICSKFEATECLCEDGSKGVRSCSGNGDLSGICLCKRNDDQTKQDQTKLRKENSETHLEIPQPELIPTFEEQTREQTTEVATTKEEFFKPQEKKHLEVVKEEAPLEKKQEPSFVEEVVREETSVAQDGGTIDLQENMVPKEENMEALHEVPEQTPEVINKEETPEKDREEVKEQIAPEQSPVCRPGQQQPCYTKTSGCFLQPTGNYLCRGTCRAGWRTCHKGKWSNRCQGEVGPSAEISDGKDNNCDGKIDDGSDISQVSLGSSFTCALYKNGKVKCLGHNFYGQLGNGTKRESLTAHEVKNLNQIKQISAGFRHACALQYGGKVFCWGNNQHGELGDGTVQRRLTPVEVKDLTNVKQISVGSSHSCALTPSGMKCWGYNRYGQLGDGTTQSKQRPTTVLQLSNVSSISTGLYYTCALLKDGNVKCWGKNKYGQLGNRNNQQSVLPSTVHGLKQVKQISASSSHTCALLRNGEARCWGNGSNHKLGTGSSQTQLTPTRIFRLGIIKQINAGFEHTCVLLTSAIWCWGENKHGQLGNGTNTMSILPTKVKNLNRIRQFFMNRNRACVLDTNNKLSCWGYNVSGELGHGAKSPWESTAVDAKNF